MKKYDCVVLGSGPGGYIGAIRASQLGNNVAIIEKNKLGGVCLNDGCIPTKALLQSAFAVHEVSSFKDMGIDINIKKLNGAQAVTRALKISEKISKGVSFLMKKNNIHIINGEGRLVAENQVEIDDGKKIARLEFRHMIIATGASYKTFPGLKHDGENFIGAWEAVKMKKLPKSIGIIGAGAIGVEFAYFWNAFGVHVHIFELQNRLLPLEDEDSSKEVEKAYKKYGIKTSLGLESVKTLKKDDGPVIVAKSSGRDKKWNFEKVLIAVGMKGNIENIGLDSIGIKTDKGFIKVNEMKQTNIPHIYAIGDVAGPPLLAHAASHEGIIAAEHFSGENPHPLDKTNIPACTYCQPQVASVGHTEKSLKEKGIEYTVGKVPFLANGKALASNETIGFVKTLVGKYGELLGAHIVGTHATELIHEYVLLRTMEGTLDEVFATVHPHPTLGEFLSESLMNAKGRSLNY